MTKPKSLPSSFFTDTGNGLGSGRLQSRITGKGDGGASGLKKPTIKGVDEHSSRKAPGSETIRAFCCLSSSAAPASRFVRYLPRARGETQMASQPPTTPDSPIPTPVDVPVPSPIDPMPPTPTDPVVGAGGNPLTEGP